MDLYENMFNLRNWNNLSIIEKVINKNKKEVELYTNDFSSLCKIISNNISCDLDEKHIKNKICNTKSLLNCYEHEFVVANYYDKEQKNVLIDLTYNQFLNINNEKLIAFGKWPGDILKETKNGLIILNNLLKNGYTFIDDELLNTYLGSFNQENNEITIESIYEEKRGIRK